MIIRTTRPEPLIGAILGTIIVGYFTSTNPNLFTSLVLCAVFLALSVQLLVMGTERRPKKLLSAANPSKKIIALACVLLPLAFAQLVLALVLVLASQHLFSIIGALCALCFIAVAVGGLPPTKSFKGIGFAHSGR